MASVKISELNELLVITSDDFIPIVDSGSGTTYRATFNVLNDWMAIYGSASHAAIADFAWLAHTASYCESSSYSLYAVTSSHAITASYYDVSWYSPENAASASVSETASCLQGRGTSWEIYLKISGSLQLSQSAYLTIPSKFNIQNEGVFQNSVFFGYDRLTVNDWGRIYFAEDVTDSGRLVFEHGDNADTQLYIDHSKMFLDKIANTNPGFLWQTYETVGPYATGSLMFLQTDGRLYVRAANAQNFTASAEGVGFHGTASHALTASYIVSSGGGGSGAITGIPPIGSIMDYAGTGAPSDPNWHLCDGTALAQASYPDLWTAIGTTWGASGGNVVLPNLNGKMTLGSAGGFTRIRNSVGQTGGGEGLQAHFHIVGKSEIVIDGAGKTKDDNLYMIWVNNRTLNTNLADGVGCQMPIENVNYPGAMPAYPYYLKGAGDTGQVQPKTSVNFGYTSDSGFVVGSSYGLNGASNADMMPPYAVVRKIIRVL